MKSNELVRRGDPAVLAILGLAALSSGDFGYELPQASAQVGADFGNDHHGYAFSPAFGYTAAFGGPSLPAFHGPEFHGNPGYTAAYGQDPTTGMMAPAMTGTPNPNNPAHHAMLMASWHAGQKKQRQTHARLGLLNPNHGSEVDVEAYVFSLNPSQFSVGVGLNWGTANGWTAFKNPQTSFRAERMFVNVNAPGVATVISIQAANVNAQIGATADAFTFSPLAQGSRVSLPTLPPQNTMQVTGQWSTVVPAPFVPGASFLLCVDFEGWATVTA
jgi:hypothetical protein